MKIQWIRVLVGGFLIEVVLAIVLVGGFAAAGVSLDTISTAAAVVIGIGCFVAAFVVVLWFGRRIDSHLVLHGFLMGLVATLLYVALVTGSGQMPTALAAYGPATFVIVNAARLVGAVLGGVAGERRRATLA